MTKHHFNVVVDSLICQYHPTKCLLSAHADEYHASCLRVMIDWYPHTVSTASTCGLPQEFQKQNKNLNQRLRVSQPNNQKVNIVSWTKITNCLQRLRVSQPSNQKVRATKFTHDQSERHDPRESYEPPARWEHTGLSNSGNRPTGQTLQKQLSRKHLVKDNKVFIQENVVNALSLCFSRSKIVQPKVYLSTKSRKPVSITMLYR